MRTSKLGGVLVAVVFLMVCAVCAEAQEVASVYTGLDDKSCEKLEPDEENGVLYLGRCEGAGGYALHIIEGDLRQTVDVITPEGEVYELRLWEHFPGFTAVGPRAEWLLKEGEPFALIFRFNVNEDPSKSEKYTSYLMVVKISETLACVTEIIDPSKDQNEQARKAANRAPNTPCKVAD